MTIFSGSANKPLATAIATELGIKLGEIEISRFANNEGRIWIKEVKVEPEVVVVQSLDQPTDHHVVEFCLICDALKRQGAKELTAVIPWLGYSKQDKVFRAGEPLSVKVVAKILQTTGIEKIITFDLHNLAILGFFDIPVVNLSANELFLEHFRQELGDKTLVVAPDAGSVKASTAFAQALGVAVAYIDKKRDLATGEVSIVGVSREVRGAQALIVDDMIVTGSTMMEVAKYLMESGAESVRVAATHHLYVPGVQTKLDESVVKEVVVTDTVANRTQSLKLRVLSVAKIIAQKIKV